MVIFVQNTEAEFNLYFKKITSDEVRYLVFEVEKYIYNYDKSFKSKTEYLSSMKKTDLTSYIWNIISKHLPNLSVIDQFARIIKIFPSTQSIEVILNNAHRQFLLKWAINAEKYHRIKTDTLHHIGGLIDYANYMSNSDLIDYITTIVLTYPELMERGLFDNKILNIRVLESSIFQYIQEASRNTTRYWINNLDIFLRKNNRKSNPIDHEICFNDDLSREGLLKLFHSAIQDIADINTVENFIDIIDNKDFKYSFHTFNSLNEKDIRNIAKGCEQYNKKNLKLLSFKGLDEYLLEIPIDVLKQYSMQMISKYPELNNLELIKDLENNNQMKIYDKLSSLIYSLRRKWLILYYLNIQSEKGINKKHNEFLNTVFRMDNEELQKGIMDVTAQNKTLQITTVVKGIADLHGISIAHWISDMPHIVLVDIAFKIAQTFSPEPNNVSYNDYYIKTEADLRKYINKMCTTYTIQYIKTLELKVLDEKPLYDGMYSYLRSINKETLSIWLERFERMHKQTNQLNGVIGNLERFDKHDKKYYLGKIIYYIKKYPKYNDPVAFDRFVNIAGAHRIIYPKRHQEKANDAYALEAYHRRVSPNIPQEKNITALIDNKVEERKNIAVYFIYRMMALYPELTDPTIYNEVIKMKSYKDIPKLINEMVPVDVERAAYLVQLYHNKTANSFDNTDLSLLDDSNLRLYILRQVKESKFLINDISQLLNGQSDYLFFSYDNFFYRQKTDTLTQFAWRMHNYDKRGEEPSGNTHHELYRYCIKKFNSIPQLLNPALFDEVVNYVEPNQYFSKEMLDKFNQLSRHQLIQFALVIYTKRSPQESKRYTDIKNYINSATKGELIRYISTGYNSVEEQLSFKALHIRARQLYFDIGEQNIFELSDQ